MAFSQVRTRAHARTHSHVHAHTHMHAGTHVFRSITSLSFFSSCYADAVIESDVGLEQGQQEEEVEPKTQETPISQSSQGRLPKGVLPFYPDASSFSNSYTVATIWVLFINRLVATLKRDVVSPKSIISIA